MSALAVVIMELGALLEIADLTGAMIASILIWFLQIEFSASIAISSFLVTSLLSFLILPSKLPFFYFTLLYGWYPPLKFFLEKRKVKQYLKTIIKFTVWLIAVTIEEILARNVLGYIQSAWLTAIIVGATFVSYLLYDILLTRIALIYQYKWRKHIFKG